MSMQDSPLAIYQRHLSAGELAYQYDPVAGSAVFPPRVIAPGTGQATLQWRISTGLGTVHAATVVHQRDQEAYNVVLVDMDEGFRLMSRVEEGAGLAPRIGARVQMRAHRPTDGTPPYPVFDMVEPA
jgi:hypothetical protein